MRPIDYPNIIFDLGGVLLNLDYGKTVQAFTKLGISNFNHAFGQLSQTHLFDQYERGEISTPQFRDCIKEAIPDGTSDETIDAAWNAMLLDLPKERLLLLETLAKNKRIVLLSNTNALHIKAFSEQLQSDHGIQDLSDYFEKLHYSYEMGMRKPEARIFETVLKEHRFKLSETLFIDDSPQHIEGARAIGLAAYHLQVNEGETILELFGQTS